MSQSSPLAPAYRIHTERLVLRCWNPADAPLLKAAIDASVEHLRPWMPWVNEEPEPLQVKVDRLRRFRGEFDLGQQFVYGVFDRDENRVLGGSGLHTRVGPGALEIGYWIHAEHINQGLATELSAALTQVAFQVHGVDRVEIHCDPRNVRSAAIPAKLGFTHEATLGRRAKTGEGAYRDTMIWTLFASEYPGCRAAVVELEVFDALDRKFIL